MRRAEVKYEVKKAEENWRKETGCCMEIRKVSFSFMQQPVLKFTLYYEGFKKYFIFYIKFGWNSIHKA